jgi:hypothetical protein
MASEDSQRSDSLDQDKRPERPEDPRVEIIGRIWKTMIPVLALSIPICTLSEHGILLPIFAIAAAGVATPCVWYFGGKREGTGRSKENQRLQDRIKELEERLANVETISRFEMQLAARERAALEDGRSQSISQSSQAGPSQKENA